ncbi:MAG: D-glycerate dehydrogenase [Candidatus Wallbacteria bacterium HGW-Wallbacteria-1]|uniref:D-glycerate dehydrogenase n=1 Tax=Candidatus Wallbacteria bacterium HGW-Wallbacteria-1 TaxID=2013854 RepID=A0A2N1PNK1_9BACT|nr:MAG: D-glycerate dehydrogenase [Candidatus Wallbacteria bacterium HGW-Wallbacteria-1]
MCDVFITRAIPEAGIRKLRSSGLNVEVSELDRDLTLSEMAAISKSVKGLVTMLSNPVGPQIMDSLPELKVIANYAVGYNNIDLAAASERGITVTNLPGVLARTTAEFTMALILSIARRIPEGNTISRAGEFHGWAPQLLLGYDLWNKRLGIIGKGEIGSHVADMAEKGFGMDVVFHNRTKAAHSSSGKWVELNELIQSSDIITIHTPLTPETRHLFTIDTFRKMKRTALLINTSRGPVVREADLVRALKEGIIAGAALDVFEKEPEIHPGLLDLKNVILAPHAGSATLETREKMALMAADSIITVLNGHEPFNKVNP